MKLRSRWNGGVVVSDVWHGAQVERLAKCVGSFLGDGVKVVATMAQIEQVPGVMVAPVLCVNVTISVKAVVRARWWKELAGGTCRQGYLNAAKADVPVDVILQNECSFETGVEKPKTAANQQCSSSMVPGRCSQGGCRVDRDAYHRSALW